MRATKTTISTTARPAWRSAVAPYERPILSKAVWQVIDSLVPYVALWGLMIFSLQYSYWVTLALSIPTAAFLVRVFIISHDCGHGSFFKSKRANDVIGFVTGALAFTPYFYWRHQHAIHHATAGNLDRRGIGDVWTLTLREYQEGSFWLRLRFRLVRNPITMLLIGPAFMFLIHHRFAVGEDKRWHLAVFWTNLFLIGLAGGLSLLIGFKGYVAIQLPVILIAGIAGVWLFYVQHQFEDMYWDRQENWDYLKACLEGSSFYKLPRILQWFSGNIGFHHIHHLSPRIPNYRLEECHDNSELFEKAKVISLVESFKCMQLRVWDEERRMMVPLRGF